MPFAVQAPDLHERIAQGVQEFIQTALCPLTADGNAPYSLPASQVYVQDWPIPETGCMFPAVILSIEGEEEQDEESQDFETDAAKFPLILRIVHRRDAWDQTFQPAAKKWRKSVRDLLRALVTLPGCPEVFDVTAKSRAIYNENIPAMEYMTSDLLVLVRGIWQRQHGVPLS